MKTAGVPEPGARARRSGIPAWRKDTLGLSLLASLVLHALVLMLQFGSPELGLPWLGLPGDERRANISALRAILRESAVVAASAEKTAPAIPVASAVRPAAVPADNTEIVSPPRATQLSAEPVVATAAIREAPLQAPSQDARDQLARVEEVPTPAAAPTPGIAVLSTDKESQWSTRVAQTARDDDTKQRDMKAAEERAEEEAQERKRVEELAQFEEEKKQAAIKAREEALERRRVEELARFEEEQRLAEQAAAAKAREEVQPKDLAAPTLARERREVAVRIGAPAMAAAGAASPAAGKPEGGREADAGPTGLVTGNGAELARRALAQAKGGTPVPVPAPAENVRRRGSLLGRDPRDIQLAFYGEGWRQKVERIGGMNYPKLSRNRTYDALVVTVSINSDGTLAGVHIDKSSGHRELDEAVRHIVEMSAPFAAFPPDLKRSYDVVDITRTWTFQEERPRISGQ